MRHRASVSAAIVGLVLASAADAEAERVVLVRPEPSDSMLVDAWHRLAAELHIHDFETEEVDAPRDTAPETALADAAEKRDAFAAIALLHHGGGASVDVWLVDRASGKTTMRTIHVDEGSDAASVLAIRAVNLLRASVREFASGDRPPPDVAGVDRRRESPALAAFIEPPEPRVHLTAGAELLVEPGFGVAAGPGIGLSYRLGGAVEVGIEGTGPLLGARLDTASGSATLQQEMAWAGARVRWLRTRWLDAGASAKAGAYFLTAEGAPHAPLRSRTDHVTAFLGGFGLDAALNFSRALAVVLGVQAFATAPRAGVAVGPDAAAIELPMIMGSAQLRVGL